MAGLGLRLGPLRAVVWENRHVRAVVEIAYTKGSTGLLHGGRAIVADARTGHRSRRSTTHGQTSASWTRDWDTRVGTIELAIPKLRTGSYLPTWLPEPRRRAERALVQVIADCYLAGGTTRRVDNLVKQLGLEGISESQVSELAKSLDEVVEGCRNRPLDARPYPCIWVDGDPEGP